MSVTVIPTPRWISLTLTFPGVGSITRDRSIYLPVECDEPIAQRLVEKFYARLVEPIAEIGSIEEDKSALESAPEIKPISEPPADLTLPTLVADTKEVALLTNSIEEQPADSDPASNPEGSETPLSRMLAAINAAQTVEELQLLGLNAAKANAVLEASPVDYDTVSQILPAKTLSALIAKHE